MALGKRSIRQGALALALVMVLAGTATGRPALDRAELDRRIAAFNALDPDSNPKAYRAAAQAALEEARRLFPAEHPEVAARRIDYALSFAAVGEMDAATRQIDAAVPVLERARAQNRARWGQAWRDALSARAFVLNFRSDHKSALALNEMIVADYRQSAAGHDEKGFAVALNNLAAAKFEAGALDEALALNAEATQRGLEVTPAIADVALWQANRVAYLYTSGRTDEAVSAARNGIARSEVALGADHAQLSSLYANLGAILFRQGRPRDALPIIRRGYELIEKGAGRTTQNSATMRVQYAQALTQSQRYAHAIAFLDDATPVIDRELGAESDRALVARDTRTIALMRLGRAAEAQALAEKLLAIRDIRLPVGHRDRANARDNLARAALANRDFPVARRAAQEAVAVRVPLLPADHPDLLLARVMALRVEDRAGTGDRTAMLAEARSLFAALAASANLDIGSAQAARLRPGFGWLAAIFASLGATEAGFAAQQWTARTALDDTIAQSQLADAATGNEALAEGLARRRALLAERQGLVARLDANLRKPDVTFDMAGVDAALAANRAAIEALDASLPPAQAMRLRFAPATLAQAGAMADKSRAALMFTALEDEWLLTAMRNGEARQWRLADRGAIDGLVHSLRDTLDAGGEVPFDREAAAALHARLFPPPAAAFLKGAREWAVAADGSLGTLPFAVLVPDVRKRAYLVDQVAIRRLAAAPRSGAVVAAGATSAHLVGLGGVSGAPAAQRLAMRAAETARSIGALPALVEAPAELAALARAAGDADARVLTGADATEAALRETQVPAGAILAFATHGLVTGELEGLVEPALLLTPDGQDDGLLMPSEIGRLNLPAQLVILSACNTAAGSGEDAPRLTGLVQGFFMAGAHGVLASHWRVRDDAARRLTVATVRALRGGAGEAAALREAVRIVRSGRDGEPALDEPALWAPFELFAR